MFKYTIGDDRSSDLKRPFQNYKFSRVAFYSEPGTNSCFTTFANLNCTTSHLVIAATRNRCLKVFDMSVGGRVVRCNDDVHDRPVHSIQCGSLSSELFLTAAADGAVKLWDMRTTKYVGDSFLLIILLTMSQLCAPL